MIKKNLKTMFFTSIIILAPMIFGLFVWNQLPSEMATHFGENGQPDGWSSKTFAVIGLPLMMLVIHWLCVAFIGVDPKNKNISDKMVNLTLWIVPIVSIVGEGTTYLYAFDNTINSTKMGIMLLGCMFLVIGNYMPKMKQSYTIGIKLPWTLESEENWNRTHRLAGYTFMTAGIITIFAALLQMFWMSLVALLAAAIIPTVYSYRLYKKGI